MIVSTVIAAAVACFFVGQVTECNSWIRSLKNLFITGNNSWTLWLIPRFCQNFLIKRKGRYLIKIQDHQQLPFLFQFRLFEERNKQKKYPLLEY